jgi:hypothetical protein
MTTTTQVDTEEVIEMGVQRATDIVRTIISEQLSELAYEERTADLIAVIAYLVSVKSTVRFYKITAKSEFEDLWNTIRYSPTLHDFVVGGASKLYLRYAGTVLHTGKSTEETWRELMKIFAAAMAICNPRESFTCTDEAYRKNGFSESEFESYFHGNPWLFFMVIATQLRFEDFAQPEV